LARRRNQQNKPHCHHWMWQLKNTVMWIVMPFSLKSVHRFIASGFQVQRLSLWGCLAWLPSAMKTEANWCSKKQTVWGTLMTDKITTVIASNLRESLRSIFVIFFANQACCISGAWRGYQSTLTSDVILSCWCIFLWGCVVWNGGMIWQIGEDLEASCHGLVTEEIRENLSPDNVSWWRFELASLCKSYPVIFWTLTSQEGTWTSITDVK
jgi:hypothetical protein